MKIRRIIYVITIIIFSFVGFFFFKDYALGLFASGGVIGNIEASIIHSDKQTADNCIQELKGKHIWFVSPDTTKYQNEDNSICTLIKDGGDTLVFAFDIDEVMGKPNETLIVITHFGKYRETITFNSELSRSQKKRCLKVFHENIIEGIKKSCGLTCDVDVW